MSLADLIHKKLTFPALLWKHGLRIGDHLRVLEHTQFLSEEELRQRQGKALREIISYAVTHVPYYRQVFVELHANPEDIQDIEDLAKLPRLTKDLIRKAGNRLYSDDFREGQTRKKRTGGSTSVPLHLIVDNDAWNFKYAATWRANRWAGYDLGDKLAALWGDTDKPLTWRQRIHRALFDRAIYLDTLKIDEAYMAEFVVNMRRFRPRILMGHAHSLFIFADYLGARGQTDLGIKGVISTAEMLSDSERERIEEVFGPILFNRYGCEEVSIIAAECETHDGLHINSDGLIVEIGPAEAGEPGPLLITDLVNHAMPLIRYEIGDMADWKTGPCDCGRGLPRLDKVHGRSTDFLYTPEGKAVSGVSILDTFTIHIPGIKQVQIIQDKIDFISIRVVKADDFSQASDEDLRDKVPQIFGDRMRCEIVYVDRIEQTRRGKYCFSICNLGTEDKKQAGLGSSGTDRGETS